MVPFIGSLNFCISLVDSFAKKGVLTGVGAPLIPPAKTGTGIVSNCIHRVCSKSRRVHAGLEARVPFADKEFIDYVMRIPPSLKKFNKDRMEKYLFRKAFIDYLPDDILWRRKEAFSDGVSCTERSWFQIIKEFVDKKYTDEEFIVLSKKF